jgi:hypothetical protein
MDTDEHGSGELTIVALHSLGLEEADQRPYLISVSICGGKLLRQALSGSSFL